MSDSNPELDRIQRWMQAVITDPAGVVAGIRSEHARQQIDISPDRVEKVVSPSQSQTSLERLGIYANAYYGRLLECLREEFRALRHAVGDEAFDSLAFHYLQAYPSRSYTLAQLASRFPQFLAETRPTPDADCRDNADWAAFLIELATLERIYSEVFDGPGVEGEALLSTADLTAIPAERWPDVQLTTVPCLRLWEFHFPVHEYASAVRHAKSEEEILVPAPATTYLAVTRRDFIVRRVALSCEQFRLLQSLAAGDPLGKAIEKSLESTEADFETIASSLQVWFREWTSTPLFWKVALPD